MKSDQFLRAEINNFCVRSRSRLEPPFFAWCRSHFLKAEKYQVTLGAVFSKLPPTSLSLCWGKSN